MEIMGLRPHKSSAPILCLQSTLTTNASVGAHSHMSAVLQSYDEVIAILLSQQSVKDIRLRVKAAFFGVEWAAAQEKETFTGTINGWKTKGEVLMVRWEGWSRSRQCPLITLKEDSDGEPLEVELLPYNDGRSRPQLVEGQVQQAVRTAADDSDDGDDDEDELKLVTLNTSAPMKPLNITELTWSRLSPDGIKNDERSHERFKPSFPTPLDLKDIISLFFYLYPDPWIEMQLHHTNPKLQGHDKLNAKLSKGELLQFWGYALALALHTSGFPLEKMWSFPSEGNNTQVGGAPGHSHWRGPGASGGIHRRGTTHRSLSRAKASFVYTCSRKCLAFCASLSAYIFFSAGAKALLLQMRSRSGAAICDALLELLHSVCQRVRFYLDLLKFVSLLASPRLELPVAAHALLQGLLLTAQFVFEISNARAEVKLLILTGKSASTTALSLALGALGLRCLGTPARPIGGNGGYPGGFGKWYRRAKHRV
ncbi:hypothetical protein AB1Y20_022363 [Prymnesium parvum]|uniref:Uncharacterized protein n=1 Tax=Prymnesium parvum TaxID=97485 RepID=A0AB34JFP0_PRYPA